MIMVKTKEKPATTTPKKDYSDPTGIFSVWNRITELKEVLNDLHEKIMQWTPDDDFYYDLSKEKTKFSQEYVDNIFDLWRYARETGAKHSRAEKVEFGIYTGEITELIPEFDQLGNFIKWNYSVMYKNEAGETEFAPLISYVPQGDVNILNSVIVDEQPAEPEAIAPEPEPEQLSLLPNELPRDLGNDYLAFKANQLIDILNSFPRDAIAVNNYFRTGGQSDPHIIIETNRGNIRCWMDYMFFEIDADEIDKFFDKPGCTIEQPWEEYLSDYLVELGFHRENDNDPVKLQKPILDRPYEYQDVGDGRYKVLIAPSPNKNVGQRFLGIIWRDEEGWITDDILPAENSRRAIAYRLHQKFKEREEQDNQQIRELVAKTRQAVTKKTKAVTELKTPGFLGKKPITESKPAGKKTKAITESKPPAKKSKPASKKTDGAIAKKSKPITELKPAPTNSVITTNGKPQGCINWSAPAGDAKVPAGTKYPSYCYHEGGKLRKCYIGGGNQQSTVAQSRVRAVEEAIAEAKTPDEIVSLIHELKRG